MVLTLCEYPLFLQFQHNPQSSFCPEEEDICGTGSQLLEAQEAVEEWRPTNKAPADCHTNAKRTRTGETFSDRSDKQPKSYAYEF